jgi:hypothetical protein
MKKIVLTGYLLFIPALKNVSAQTWTYINAGTAYNVGAVSFVNDSTGYIAGGIWSGPGGPNYTFLKRTDNSGQSFTVIYDSSGSTPICQMHFFTPVSGLYRRWQNSIQKTINGGLNESSILPSGNFWAGSRFQVFDSLHLFYFGYGLNELYYTANGGQSWITYGAPTLNGIAGGFLNPDTGFFCPQISTVYRTFNAGSTWTVNLSGIYASAFRCINDSIVLLFGINVILRSVDSGDSWDTVYTTSPLNYINSDFRDGLLVVCGSGGMVLKSYDYGASWINDSPPTTQNLAGVSIANAQNECFYVVGNNNTMYRHCGSLTGVSNVSPGHAGFFPNPFSEATQLFCGNFSPGDSFQFTLFDSFGRTVKSTRLKCSDKIFRNKMDAGFYLYLIESTNGKTKAGKLIIQ